MNLKSFLKQIIVILVRAICMRKVINTKLPYTIFDSGRKHTFFGYYDKSPFGNDDIILATATNAPNTPIQSPDHPLDIGYFRLDNPKDFIKIDETYTWCWQQGCRLMWFNRKEQEVFFNTFENQQYGSKVVSLKNHSTINTFPFPLYDISRNTDWGLSLDFSRLQRLRPGYGYCNSKESSPDTNAPKNDGLWLCDLKAKKKYLLFSLLDLSLKKTEPSMDQAQHYINHLSFNPTGSHFLFFHLWLKNGKRRSRAIVSDLFGQKTHFIEHDEFVSHYAWKNDYEILLYTRKKQNLGYFLFNLINNNSTHYASNILCVDGHPTFTHNSSNIITDTYPSRFYRESSLHFFNQEKNDLDKLASFYLPHNYSGENRCDLHPRLAVTSDKIAIDAVYNCGRKLICIDTNGI